jgi:hypothetical protein
MIVVTKDRLLHQDGDSLHPQLDTGQPIGHWPARVEEWIRSIGILLN